MDAENNIKRIAPQLKTRPIDLESVYYIPSAQINDLLVYNQQRWFFSISSDVHNKGLGGRRYTPW